MSHCHHHLKKSGMSSEKLKCPRHFSEITRQIGNAVLINVWIKDNVPIRYEGNDGKGGEGKELDSSRKYEIRGCRGIA